MKNCVGRGRCDERAAVRAWRGVGPNYDYAEARAPRTVQEVAEKMYNKAKELGDRMVRKRPKLPDDDERVVRLREVTAVRKRERDPVQ